MISALIEKSSGKVIQAGAIDFTKAPDYDEFLHEIIENADPGIKVYRKGQPYHQKVGDEFVLHEIDLEDEQEKKIIEIDSRTKEIIATGFTFDGHVFSLSHTAQINWLAIKNNHSMFTDPIPVTTIDDQEYALSISDIDSFFGTALVVKQTALATGRALKIQVKSATTKEQILSVEDNR